MSKIMTAQQAFNVSMNKYPSLYTDTSLEKAKLKYYNQVFNVIGNGYRNINEFVEAHTINKKNKTYIESFPDKYITSKALYEAYTEVDERRSYHVGKNGSELEGLYTEEQLKHMPQVKYSMQVNKDYRRSDVFVPYPNFQKQYSIMWEDVNILDTSWFEEAQFFYTKCKEFFAGQYVHLYHYAMPLEEDTKAWNKLINSYEENFVRSKIENMTKEEYYTAISKAYEMEYLGDTKQFIKNRWQAEQARINEFLDETLERLQVLLNQTSPKVKNKR